MRALGWLVAAAVSAAFIAALLLAAHAGQARRCAWLTAHNSPSTSTYDCHTTGAR